VKEEILIELGDLGYFSDSEVFLSFVVKSFYLSGIVILVLIMTHLAFSLKKSLCGVVGRGK